MFNPLFWKSNENFFTIPCSNLTILNDSKCKAIVSDSNLDKSGDRSKNSYGLGLATVERILSLHKSKYSISNTKDGVIFKFTLKKQDLAIDEFE